MEMGLKPWLLKALPFAAMVMLEFLDTGLTTIGKAAISQGMSHYIFVIYSNALATLILFPLSFLFNRPPTTFLLLCKFFLLSMLGITAMQNLVFTGISYSSPTLASALGQLIPAYTFVLAIIFRMEKLDIRSSKSQVKVISTLVLMSGAFVIIFYKGPSIGAKTSSPTQPSPPTSLETKNSWVIGGLFIATAGLSISLWTTFQAVILKDYSAKMNLVFLYCLFGTIQCAIVALIAEKDPNAWKLNHSMELISVVYSSLVGSVITPCVITWCIENKGPVFVAMFKPLGIVIAAFLGNIFLGDTLHLGSIIGAVIIVVGFYGVIWAKSKEEEQWNVSQKAKYQRAPLLESQPNV